MLINLSNHPSQYWNKRQLEAIHCYGEIVDIPFPVVAPDADSQELQTMAQDCVQKSLSIDKGYHIIGEMTLTFMVVKLLKKVTTLRTGRLAGHQPIGSES